MGLALYRKYRPKSFSEVIGQDYLVEVLKNSAKKNRFAHAYLFYGPRGTGKTTTARLIAKAVNCLSEDFLKRRGEPCNKCRVCLEIDVGRAMDVVEIDAASNRGIDEIRNIRDSIRLSPSSCRRKVFIIDESHMLTKEAFNALLKVLEEPPEHAILILATTEYDKVPPTIVSRAQRFHLKKVAVDEIFGKLKKISGQESFKITDDALRLVAAAAEGSLRDAESLLDQITSLTDSADLKSVEGIIGRVGLGRVSSLADCLAGGDIQGALRQLAEVGNGGGNLTDLNKELINYLRRALALRFDPELEQVFVKELAKEELELLKKHSQLLEPEKNIALIKSLIRAYSEMRYSPFPHVPLEVAIIENLK